MKMHTVQVTKYGGSTLQLLLSSGERHHSFSSLLPSIKLGWVGRRDVYSLLRYLVSRQGTDQGREAILYQTT